LQPAVGARDQGAELGISVFEVPAADVRAASALGCWFCNSVAQSVVESVRGQHDEFVFVYRAGEEEW
jgi:hypothetical protein